MAVRNLEIKKQGERYIVAEQVGSDRHNSSPVYEAGSREDADRWLREQGGAPDLVADALQNAEAGPAFLELAGNWDEAEGFPRR